MEDASRTCDETTHKFEFYSSYSPLSIQFPSISGRPAANIATASKRQFHIVVIDQISLKVVGDSFSLVINAE